MELGPPLGDAATRVGSDDAARTVVNDGADEQRGGETQKQEEGRGHNGPRNTSSTTQDDHFAAAHGKQAHAHATRSGPLTIRHLWKPPVVRQWLHDGKLYKESSGREPSRLELFFDLAYAGIIHQLAEQAAESANGIGLAKFVLIFYPSWSLWKDMRDYSNISGSDDIKFRLYILVVMLLLYGYSSNASGIEIEPNEAEPLEPGGEPIRVSGYHFAESAHSAIQAAIAFFLIAKAFRIGFLLYNGIYLPRFRLPFLLTSLAIALSAAIYFPLLFVTNSKVIVALPSVAIGCDIAFRYVLGAVGKIHFHRHSTDLANPGSGMHIPAINVEHLIERTLQFTVIFFGESVISSIYRAAGSQLGPHTEYGRSALGIIIAFSLIWLYFDQDSSRTFVHALRRHWIANISYTQLHFPLCAGIVIFSSSLSVLVPETEASDGIRWYFSGGIATTLLCIALIGCCHRSMDQHRSGLLPRSARLGLRFVISALIATFPLFEPEDTTAFIAIVAAILAALVAVETLGKLGSVRVDLEVEPANKSQRKAQKHYDRHKHDLTENEKGEEDVGIETELGDMEVRDLHRAQRLAYTA